MKCLQFNCSQKQSAKGYCGRHYQQILKHGHTLERTKYDPNEYIKKGNICLISIYNKNMEKVAEAIIDEEDMDKCFPYRWGLSSKEKYVRNRQIGALHNLILGRSSSGMFILPDHIDGNTLNNTKQNLQVITSSQNQMKKKLPKHNTSGYRGVYFHKQMNKWKAQIGKEVRIHIGFYSTKEEAALAYNEKAKELFGRFAVLNKIGGTNESRKIRIKR